MVYASSGCHHVTAVSDNRGMMKRSWNAPSPELTRGTTKAGGGYVSLYFLLPSPTASLRCLMGRSGDKAVSHMWLNLTNFYGHAHGNHFARQGALFVTQNAEWVQKPVMTCKIMDLTSIKTWLWIFFWMCTENKIEKRLDQVGLVYCFHSDTYAT